MRRALLAFVGVGLFASLGWADDTLRTPIAKKAPKPLDEIWEAAYVLTDTGKDVKIGHVHLTSVPLDKDGQKLIRTTKVLRFVVGRADALAEMKADMSTDEDGDGKVHAIKAKMWLGKDRTQTIDCEIIDGPKVRVSTDAGVTNTSEYRWDPSNLGLAREQTLLQDRKVKTGDEFTYKYFEPQVTHPVTVKVSVKDIQEVAFPGSVKRKLLKVIATPSALKLSNGGTLQLPPSIFWADPVTFDIVASQMDSTELGKVTLVRTSKIAALAPNGQVPDLMKRQSIFLKAAVPDMHERGSTIYRIAFSGDAQPKDLVSVDDRQAIKNAAGQSFELHMTARRAPVKGATAKAGPEFLRSNYFINSDDVEVKKLAAKAVGPTTDAWDKARKIESFVRHFMKPADYTEAMAPADHVARTRSGDCTEYSMLAAAMCRAVGVPSRTAIGLVYVNNLLGKPGLAFHMWTEVFVQGQWLAIDATLGQGSIGPGHIKITDHSWDGVISFTPLLPVKGFIMASPTVEVVSGK